MKPKRVDENKPGKNKKPNKDHLPLTRGDLILRGIIIALSVILALILVFIVVYNSVGKAPDLPNTPTATATSTGTETDEINSAAPKVTGDRKENFYTFLLVGHDQVSNNTDTIMLAAYDVKNQKISVMSIPRDTMVNVNWDVKKINSVYNVGGMDMLKEEVASLIGFEPDFTVDINLEAFGKLVDAIGGVDFDIPYNMNYDDPVQDLHIHFTAGSQHLDGDDAMRVVRFRKNNDGTHSDGDVGRIKLQQSFMTALLKQCLTIQNVTKISDFAKIFNEDVTTELSVDNIIYFGKAIISGGMNSSNVNFFTMPYTSGSVWSRTQGSYLSYVFPTSDDLIDDVNSDMNPYQKQVTLKNLDLMGVSSNGKITSSSGVIEDSKANSSTPSKTSASTKAATDDDVEIPAPAKTTTSTKTAATASTKATSAGETTTKGTPAEATTTATKATAADDTTTKTTPAADAANAAADTANSPDD